MVCERSSFLQIGSLLAVTFTDAKESQYFCGKNLSAWSYKVAIEAAIGRINATAQR